MTQASQNKGQDQSASHLRPSDPWGVHPPPIQPFEQCRQLRRRQPHDPVADRRPFELGAFQPLPDQHQTGPVIDQDLHPVGAFRAEHEDRPAERILPQHRLHRRRQTVSAAAEVHRPRRDQHPHSRWWRARESRDHFIAFNRRSTLPSKPSSTPAPTRTIAPPISISIAAAPEPPSATTGTKSGPYAPTSAIIGNRSELPPPTIELVAMQPVAQRDLARLRARRLA